MVVDTIRIGGGDTRPLLGDLHRPAGDGPHPVLVGVSGGGWRRGDRTGLAAWGAHFAAAGIAFLSIDYRRATDGPVFPGNAADVAEGLRFVAASGPAHGLDPLRIGVIGASAGAHLSALALLSDAFDTPPVKAWIGVYGVYDLVTHWQADLAANAAPGEDLTEKMLGCTPYDDQRLYFDASPIRHVHHARALPALMIWGGADREVLPAQSDAFATALRQARFPLRTQVVQGAGHMWFSEDAPGDPHGHSVKVAPLLTRFVRQHLGAAR